jgi:hypothetical protein
VHGLAPETIHRVVRSHAKSLQACYTAESSKDPTIHGSVRVKWLISADGSVSDQHVEASTLQSPRVEACVLRDVGSWQFPASDGRNEVSFPFTFGGP